MVATLGFEGQLVPVDLGSVSFAAGGRQEPGFLPFPEGGFQNS
jgi:hypothetical protein